MATKDINYPPLSFFETSFDTPKTKFNAQEVLDFNENIPSRVDPTCATRMISVPPLDEATKFATLIDLFDRVGYEGQALTTLVEKIQYDPRFLGNFLPNSEDLQKILIECLTKEGNNLWDEALKQPLTYESMKPVFNSLSLEGKIKWENTLKEHTKKQLQHFIDNISGKDGSKGDQTGVINSRKNCKQVIHYLEKLCNEMENEKDDHNKRLLKLTIQETLRVLAIEGGNYCATAITEVVRDCYQAMIRDSGVEVTIQTHFDLMALETRTELFKKIYMILINHSPWPLKSLFEAIGPNDIHVFNKFQQLCGRGLGLDLSGAKNDNTAEVNVFLELFLTVFHPFVRLLFWNTDINEAKLKSFLKEWDQVSDDAFYHLHQLPGSFYKATLASNLLKFKEEASYLYDEDTLIMLAKQLIDDSVSVSRHSYITWWKEYIESLTENDDDLREKLICKIMYNQDANYTPLLIEDNLFIGNDKAINKKYVKLMLIEMGILKKPEVENVA
jgi:hypothetical protein